MEWDSSIVHMTWFFYCVHNTINMPYTSTVRLSACNKCITRLEIQNMEFEEPV